MTPLGLLGRPAEGGGVRLEGGRSGSWGYRSDMDIGHIAPMVIVGLVLGLFGWGRAHLGQTVAMQ